MNTATRTGFRFGLEVELMLVDGETFRPLWHPDLSFAGLNEVLESIPLDGLPPLDGLDLEPPHRKLMPYAVEGYHVPAPDLSPIDLMPKGVEIRTPVRESIDECLRCYELLHGRLREALGTAGCRPVAISHHPVEWHFRGPQNKRRHDFWQWAMQVMTTYGPDVNVSLPSELDARIDTDDLHRKVNYYGPALTALTLASPFYRGDLWRVRGGGGKSVRTHRRSVIAPAIELHPDEGGRMEFKLFEATASPEVLRTYLLMWLCLLLDEGLAGRADDQSRVYDLGSVARFGLDAEDVRSRVAEVLDRAPALLREYGFDSTPLGLMRQRLRDGRVPADDLIASFERCGSIPEVMRELVGTLGVPA